MDGALVTIRVHGPLGDKYGHEHRFAISTPREAVAALDANYSGFRRDFLKTERYALLVDGDWRDDPSGAVLPASREIDFHPIIEGRISGLIIAGVTALTGITGIAATIIGSALTIGLLVGVSLLLTPKAKKTSAGDSAKDESYMFSGPENVTEQGAAVPIVYGRCFVGSVVVSAGLEVTEIATEASTVAVAAAVAYEPPVPAGRRKYVPEHA